MLVLSVPNASHLHWQRRHRNTMATFVPEGNEESLVFLRDRAISEVRGVSLLRPSDLAHSVPASLRSGGCPQSAGKP